ncbi:MAG: phosphoenolpyruvate carboxykinase (ATP) [Aggregatilineales bacterium]
MPVRIVTEYAWHSLFARNLFIHTTFSTCFGAPFMVLPPTVYAHLLGEKIATPQVNVWLINTGWSGGPYGVGHRISIAHTRALVHAALNGDLANVEYRTDPNFSLAVPTTCPNVPSEVLDPRATWADGADYDAQAQKLAAMFVENFKVFEDQYQTPCEPPARVS